MVDVALHIQIRRNGRQFLNTATVRLLETVNRCGSLRTAAQEMHLSYQHAWNLVDEVNRSAREPVVIKQRGGAGGGGAHLSAHGRHLLHEFVQIERLVGTFTRKLNAEINM